MIRILILMSLIVCSSAFARDTEDESLELQRQQIQLEREQLDLQRQQLHEQKRQRRIQVIQGMQTEPATFPALQRRRTRNTNCSPDGIGGYNCTTD